MGKTKDEEIEKLKQKVDALKKNIDTINQQHDETLVRTENDKQQTLLLSKKKTNFNLIYINLSICF